MSRSSRASSFGRGRAAVAWAVLRIWLVVLTGSFGLLPSAFAQQPTPFDHDPALDDPLFSLESPLGPIDYHVGRGLRLGRTGLSVGGFSSLEIDKIEGEPGTLALDGISFLILWEPLDFLRGFAELEIGNLLEVDLSSGDTRSDASVDIERLYGELNRGDALNLRIGKFQTPVGIWNQVPAEPFTWTANEPIQVETAFDEHETGGAFYGSIYPDDEVLEYWIHGQFMGPLDPSESPEPIDNSVGGRLRYGSGLGEWALGSSFLASERDGRWSFLGGLDAAGRVGPLELQGEFVYGGGNLPERNLWGIYVQGVYGLGHLTPQLRSLYFVTRYEYFAPRDSPDSNLWNVGLAWLPTRFLILKAGYQFTNRTTDEVDRGLFSSISILF